MLNLLKNIELTSKEIEQQVSEYKLIFYPTKTNNDVEWHIALPYFVVSFYDYVSFYNKIPTQDEFYYWYNECNRFYFNSMKYLQSELDGIKTRVYRAYPSLVRDLHFGKLLSELNIFDKVIYNTILDYMYGVDLVLVKNNKTIGLNLFTDSKAGHRARVVKQDRTKQKLSFNTYDLPIPINTYNRVGDFNLYSKKQAITIVSALFKDKTKAEKGVKIDG